LESRFFKLPNGTKPEPQQSKLAFSTKTSPPQHENGVANHVKSEPSEENDTVKNKDVDMNDDDTNHVAPKEEEEEGTKFLHYSTLSSTCLSNLLQGFSHCAES
jgi:hypothetical protein